MHYLISGGAGYIGSQVTTRLLNQGHKVRILDRFFYGADSVLPFTNHPDFELIHGDVGNLDDWQKAVKGVDGVVHLASIVGEPACKLVPKLSWRTNYDSISIMMQAMKDVKRLIFISTCSNYGVSSPDAEVDEQGALNPLSDYAKAKVAAEKTVMEKAEQTAVSILRLGTIFGLSARMRFDLLINEMARDTVLDRELQIFAPEAWRPYVHVWDAARAIETIFSAPTDQIKGRVFNIVSENKKKSDLLNIAKDYDVKVKYSIVEKQPDLRDYRVSGAAFRKAFDFSYQYDVKAGFAEVANAIKSGLYRDAMAPYHAATALSDAALQEG
jgi:nucleoside-diphosphate-sugar epimerase